MPDDIDDILPNISLIKELKPLPSPIEIFEGAKKTILHQDKALKKLSTLLYYHLKAEFLYYEQRNLKITHQLNSTEFEKQDIPETFSAPIFLTGKTGSGKTHLIQELCRLHDINFLAINSTHLSNNSYKGMTLADVGDILLQNAKQDIVQAEFSVIFFDEFDKLFIGGHSDLALYHRALITELLTVIEGGKFPCKEHQYINANHMLFILGGSFGLHQPPSTIGFLHHQYDAVPKNQLGLTQMGLPDELAGRIGMMIELEPLDDTMLADILCNSPTSPYTLFANKLRMEQCTVSIEDDLVAHLIQQQRPAIEKFGVRGLYQGFNQLPALIDVLIQATQQGFQHFFLTIDGYTTFDTNGEDLPELLEW